MSPFIFCFLSNFPTLTTIAAGLFLQDPCMHASVSFLIFIVFDILPFFQERHLYGGPGACYLLTTDEKSSFFFFFKGFSHESRRRTFSDHFFCVMRLLYSGVADAPTRRCYFCAYCTGAFLRSGQTSQIGLIPVGSGDSTRHDVRGV